MGVQGSILIRETVVPRKTIHTRHSLNAVNELGIRSEPGGVIGFVLEEDAGHFVRDELLGHHFIVAGHEKVRLNRTLGNGQHQSAETFRGRRLRRRAPQS